MKQNRPNAGFRVLARNENRAPSKTIYVSKQEIRSAKMQQRILLSTLDCIHDLGFQNASTVEIAKRAGVSRGALLHHFPTKESLIASAVEHLLDQEIVDLRKIADAYSNQELSIDDFVDYLWERFSGRLFMITIDFLSSARTDETLRNAIIPISKKFHTSLNETWEQFFQYRKVPPKQVQDLLNTTLCLMRGMGVQTIIRSDEEYYNTMISGWKSILLNLLDDHPEE